MACTAMLIAERDALRGDNEALTQALADERARTIAETQRADAAERKLAADRDRVRPWGKTLSPHSEAVSVCGICDIAGCHHIRERQLHEIAIDALAGKDGAQ